MNKFFKKFLIILIICILLMPLFLQIPFADSEKSFCKELWPDAEKITNELSPFPHQKVYDNGLKGYCVETKVTAPGVYGYGGHINMMLGINNEGQINAITIIEHNESSYVTGLNNFIKQFVKKDPGERFYLGKNIDGITHATVTTNAIINSINETLNKVNFKILKIKTDSLNQKSLNIIKKLKDSGIVPHDAKYWEKVQ